MEKQTHLLYTLDDLGEDVEGQLYITVDEENQSVLWFGHLRDTLVYRKSF